MPQGINGSGCKKSEFTKSAFYKLLEQIAGNIVVGSLCPGEVIAESSLGNHPKECYR